MISKQIFIELCSNVQGDLFFIINFHYETINDNTKYNNTKELSSPSYYLRVPE